MINGTGMIETDKLLLEIVNKTAKNNFSIMAKVLIKHNIPDIFLIFKSSFFITKFTFEKAIKIFKYSEELHINH